MEFHATLMRHAVSADSPTILALAGVLSTAFEVAGVHVLPIRGLDALETQWLLAHWFPGADSALSLAWDSSDVAFRCASRHDEMEDLVVLLEAHADPGAGTTDEVHCVAHALACAFPGANHLWQDLRLPSRRELSALLGYWFPLLAAKNVYGMKWKKFFYKQLCEREGLVVCKAPSCGLCPDWAHCFGPE
ncbi:nitrogen fixation protein NifQ [Trinickia symbiotica]|uniref:Nitrogen fixation protein NifQ n=1 Tax=Trinickia symbiotica TaxID=863227 RepID=A0A2N7WPB4_9BURK|nr:nitrogen fixation protein NifQ [Trinickia symbiotica]PMS31191.1 nitrogen fixation protein NifQ [Trinickia symbiotica]PPK41352.1 nitrogen fixation protein NifQ [Trinickia symbiotica]